VVGKALALPRRRAETLALEIRDAKPLLACEGMGSR
jgi:hypothetical protein